MDGSGFDALLRSLFRLHAPWRAARAGHLSCGGLMLDAVSAARNRGKAREKARARKKKKVMLCRDGRTIR